MGKPHPMELRERVVAFVEEGNTHRSAAAHFRVSIKFVNDMVRLKRETGSLEPKPQGNGGWSKLGAYDDWARQRMAGQSDMTQEALTQALLAEHGIRVAVSSVGYWLHRLGLSHKNLWPAPSARGLSSADEQSAQTYPVSWRFAMAKMELRAVWSL